MRLRQRFIAIMLVPALFLSGCGGGASTPEAAFEGFKTSMQNEDFKTGFTYLTPESQETMLTVIMFPIAMMKGFGGSTPELDAVLEKHGINLESKDENPIANVKDKGACFQDLMNAMKSMEGADQREQPFGSDEFKNATLTEVKIDGAVAQGMAGGEPVHFALIDGKWLIDMKKSMEANMGDRQIDLGEMPDPSEMFQEFKAGETPAGTPGSLGAESENSTPPNE